MPVVYTWQDIYGWYDFDDPDYVEALHAEVRRVIDAVYGNLELPARPGSAHGAYDAMLFSQNIWLVLLVLVLLELGLTRQFVKVILYLVSSFFFLFSPAC